jgi:hypothetical protein
MILLFAVLVFSIKVNGHLQRSLGESFFGFLGLAWFVVLVSVFVEFGWKVGALCMCGSYCFSIIVSGLSEKVADLLRGHFSRD